MTDQQIRHLYGSADSRLQKNMWETLTISGRVRNINESHHFGYNIDLNKFYANTTPYFYLYYCEINEVSCVTVENEPVWELLGTINGVCLNFNPRTVIPKLRNGNPSKGYVK